MSVAEPVGSLPRNLSL